jgi:uncharacterized repeat protein (TIGR01451 family)
MLKIRFGLALALALTTALVLSSVAGASRSRAHRAQANLTIRMAGPSTAAAGQDLTYTLTVRNFGPKQARGVVVRDRLPAGTTLEAAQASRGRCFGSTVVTCSLGRMKRFAVARVVITANAPDAGRLVNVATVRSNQRDFSRLNNTASLVTVVGNAGADLGVSQTATPRPATMGKSLTYTLTVRNHSTVDATDVVLTERIPGRTALVSATPSQGTCVTTTTPITCSLGTIAAGATAQVTVVVQPKAIGFITNRARVDSATVDPFRGNNSRALQVRVRAA